MLNSNRSNKNKIIIKDQILNYPAKDSRKIKKKKKDLQNKKVSWLEGLALQVVEKDMNRKNKTKVRWKSKLHKINNSNRKKAKDKAILLEEMRKTNRSKII
jgi:hypothetical protein